MIAETEAHAWELGVLLSLFCRNFAAVNTQIDVVQNEGGDADLLVCSGLSLLLGLSQFREALSEFVVSSLARPTLSQLQWPQLVKTDAISNGADAAYKYILPAGATQSELSWCSDLAARGLCCGRASATNSWKAKSTPHILKQFRYAVLKIDTVRYK